MTTKPPGLVGSISNAWAPITRLLDALQPLAALAARVYVAQVFFLSGLTKLRDWGTTVALFTDEYKVPLLSPTVAAVLGTAGELVLPVLLVLGLVGRFSAIGLFVVNAVAVIALIKKPQSKNQRGRNTGRANPYHTSNAYRCCHYIRIASIGSWFQH